LNTFWFEQQKIPKKFDLCQLFSFDRFLPIFLFATLSLSFEFFWSRNFRGGCYSSIYYICGGFELKPEANRGLIICYACTNVANRIVFTFVWRKFSIVGIGEWWDELKNGQKLKLGDAHASPQEISKKYKRQSLGMPPRHPFFIGINQVTFQDTIFLLLHALCIFLGASVVLVFSISLI
jgi:hypothetical protein